MLIEGSKKVSAASIVLSLLAGALFSIYGASAENLLPYENEGQVRGAAAGAGRFGEASVNGVLDYCESLDPRLEEKVEPIRSRWMKRNAALLAASDAIYEEVVAKINSSEEISADEKEKLIRWMTDLVRSNAEILVRYVQTAPTQALKIMMCEDYFSAVDSGKFDVHDDDPRVMQLLRDRQKSLPKP